MIKEPIAIHEKRCRSLLAQAEGFAGVLREDLAGHADLVPFSA